MKPNIIAAAEITIDAPPQDVWHALVTPEVIREYMFGTHVTSEWRNGSAIRWEGEWQGRRYEDRGTILRFEPEGMWNQMLAGLKTCVER